MIGMGNDSQPGYGVTPDAERAVRSGGTGGLY
jgi:hypothetical protein